LILFDYFDQTGSAAQSCRALLQQRSNFWAAAPSLSLCSAKRQAVHGKFDHPSGMAGYRQVLATHSHVMRGLDPRIHDDLQQTKQYCHAGGTASWMAGS
jgi:hypothetical protein